MAATPFRITCIGFGHRLAQIIVHLRRVAPQMEFVAYADPTPAGLPRLRKHGIDPQAHFDPAAMLRSARPDAVMIGSTLCDDGADGSGWQPLGLGRSSRAERQLPAGR